jgi:hypothetical protein
MNQQKNWRLLLVSSPALLSSFFLTLVKSEPVQAVEVEPQNSTIRNQPVPSAQLECDRTNCTGNNYLAKVPEIWGDASEEQFPNLEKNDQGHLLLDVSEEESDTAVQMFGCDCVKAINALRQLRGIPIGVEGDRILPGPLIRPCTQRLPEA